MARKILGTIYDGQDGTPADLSVVTSSQNGLATPAMLADIEELKATVNYVTPDITSFTMTPATTQYEIGTTVNTITLNWTLNKEVTSQTLNAVSVAANIRTESFNDVNANRTFTLTVNDGSNDDTSSLSIRFLPKIYWGSATLSTLSSSAVVSLSDSALSANRLGTRTITVATDEYGVIAIPESYGTPTFTVGGFSGGFSLSGTIDVTNASGYTQSYNVYRTDNPSLGSINVVIS